jgi:hypothetical protein
MPIDTILDAAAQKILDHSGADATYTPDGGTVIPCKVFYRVEIEEQPSGLQGTAWAPIQTIEGLLSDWGQEPNKDDVFVVGSTSYTVFRVLDNDGRWCKVGVK